MADNSETPTVRPTRKRRKSNKKKNVLPPVDEKSETVTRTNCFGETEELDRKSVDECIQGEDRLNAELERYLYDISRAKTRTFKKIETGKDNDE